MADLADMMPLSFLKLEKYTGSSGGMRYRMEMLVKEDDSRVLLVTAWPEPYAYDYTEEEKKRRAEFSFDEAGIREGVDWLNARREEITALCRGTGRN